MWADIGVCAALSPNDTTVGYSVMRDSRAWRAGANAYSWPSQDIDAAAIIGHAFVHHKPRSRLPRPLQRRRSQRRSVAKRLWWGVGWVCVWGGGGRGLRLETHPARMWRVGLPCVERVFGINAERANVRAGGASGVGWANGRAGGQWGQAIERARG